MMFFHACKQSNGSLQLEAVPADALFVIALENKQITDKSGLDHPEDFKIFDYINKAIGENEEVASFYNKLVRDSKAAGVDKDRFYLYGATQEEGIGTNYFDYGALIVKLSDAEVFEALLKVSGLTDIQDRGTYKMIESNDLTVVWNKQIAQIFGGNVYQIDFETSFKRPKNILSVADFEQFQQRSYDVGLWMSYGALMTRINGMKDVVELTGMSKFIDEFSDTHIHAYLDFNDAEILLSIVATPQDKMELFYKNLAKEFNQQLLNDSPETSFFAFNMSVNMAEYIRLLKDMTGNAILFDEMLNDATTSTVINAFEGDLLLNLYGFAQGPLPLPLAGVGFTVKDRESFDRLVFLLKREMPVSAVGEHYSVSLGGFIPAYFAFKDNRVLVTNDAENIAEFLKGRSGKTLASNPIGNIMKESHYSSYINLDFDSYPEAIRNLAQASMGNKFESFRSTISPFKDLTVRTTDKYRGSSMSLRFKNKGNSLKQLLQSIDKIVAESGSL
jgi:hypothetical protein